MTAHITLESAPGYIYLDRQLIPGTFLSYKGSPIVIRTYVGYYGKQGYMHTLTDYHMYFPKEAIGHCLEVEESILKNPDRTYICSHAMGQDFIRVYYYKSNNNIEIETKDGSMILTAKEAHSLGNTLSSLAYDLK